MNRVLVIASHPDDEILGVGATIARHVANGDIAECVILGEGQTSRYQSREQAGTEIVTQLHNDTLLAAKEIGYQNVYFANLPDNRFDQMDLLDIIKIVEERIDIFKPNIIYTHYEGDLNIDHQQTFRAVLTAARPVNQYCVKEIYVYETLSSTEWNFSREIQGFKPNVFIDVENYFIHKVNAMKRYETELCEFPHPRSIRAMEIQAQRWGSVVGKNYVEAFELIRKVD